MLLLAESHRIVNIAVHKNFLKMFLKKPYRVSKSCKISPLLLFLVSAGASDDGGAACQLETLFLPSADSARLEADAALEGVRASLCDSAGVRWLGSHAARYRP